MNIIVELWHLQTCIQIITNNTTAKGVIKNTIQPKRRKPMDMWLHWLWDHYVQEQLKFKWKRDKHNYSEYTTKHDSAAHHEAVREIFLTPFVRIKKAGLTIATPPTRV